ncbi:hypothetical protein BDQ12DRAFT_651711 [Crucibulum laeve]|uniref:DNA mismatch repair protein PMS1 n=1 Tax=Crucibulum laeve TaxID=68775 RepID=A0A5C3M1I8_9AGAR|nr:hypothetical protein BDQ12DRAFT_651711 [Crucibulum laeve]
MATPPPSAKTSSAIKPIDKTSIHRITSGQVVIDLQTAVKELVENSIDAGATNIEVRFKNYGLKSIEVVDNGCGIAEEDYESIALKHHTSKLESFIDLTTVRTFGFRGEALSSLCALCESVVVITSTDETAPMGVSLEMEQSGKVKKRGTVARQRGTTTVLTSLFLPLPVRRKEFERNAKREFGKALALLNAYALGPCAAGSGVRLTVSNQADKGQKSVQIRTQGTPSPRASVTALWGPKALDNIVDLDLKFEVERERGIGARRGANGSQLQVDITPVSVKLKGLVSKFVPSCGRTGTDRQFFYVNGRPCNLTKIQKAFNEVYRSFNATQAPFILADFIIPTESCDINVSPDKRTIFLHSEGNLISALKAALETHFAPSRATYDTSNAQSKTQQTLRISVTNNNRRASLRKEIVDAEKSESDEGEEMGEDQGKDSPSKSAPKQKVQSRENTSVELSEPRQQLPLPSFIPEPFPPVADSSMLTHLSRAPSAPAPTHSSPSAAPSPRQVSKAGSAHLPGHPMGSSPLPPADLSYTSTSQPLFISGSDDEAEDEGQGFAAKKVTLTNPVIVSERCNSLQTASMEPGPNATTEDMDVDAATRSPSLPTAKETSPISLKGALTEETVSDKEDDAFVVADTTRTVWSQSAGLSSGPPSDDDGEDEEPLPTDEPPRKKRKSDVGDISTRTPSLPSGNITKNRSVSQSRPTLRQSTPKPSKKVTREVLRNRLVGFARTGSQVPIATLPEDEEESEEESLDGPEEEPEDEPEYELEEDELNDSSPFKSMKAKIGPILGDSQETSTDVGSEQLRDTSFSYSGGLSSSSAIDLSQDDEDPSSILSHGHQSSSSIPSSITLERAEVIKSSDSSPDISLRFDIKKIVETWTQLCKKTARGKDSQSMEIVADKIAIPKVPIDAGVSNTEEHQKAADALSRIIEKTDFANMEVVGQFNLGFIVVRLRKGLVPSVNGHEQDVRAMDDLFIVDQHAADEKYNFETLQLTTRIQSQKLFKSQALELTASDELLAIENIEVLHQNGFELEVDEDGCSGQGSRLKLTAQPTSKSTVFDMKDLEEIIHLMRNRPTGQMVRCSKARSMFAMRACRKSVMVGMPLNRHQMSNVVRHMGTIDQPWNCPHGRPTMRHLLDVKSVIGTSFGRKGGSGPVKVDWSIFE